MTEMKYYVGSSSESSVGIGELIWINALDVKEKVYDPDNECGSWKVTTLKGEVMYFHDLSLVYGDFTVKDLY